jgi:hypothetical protein
LISINADERRQASLLELGGLEPATSGERIVMDRNLPKSGARALALVASAFVAAGTVAAQTTVKEVTVEAPRTVTTRLEPGDSIGRAQVKVTTIKVRVSYADLDLTRSQDFQKLRMRVKAAANGACADLDKLYPREPDPNCIARTIVTANAHADAASVDAIKRTLP